MGIAKQNREERQRANHCPRARHLRSPRPKSTSQSARLPNLPLIVRVLALSVLTCFTALAQDNGIAAGRPKIYDNRSLTIMLNQLNASLANTMFIDPSSLAAALSFYQGSEVQSVYRSLSLGVASPAASGGSALSATSGGGSGSGTSGSGGTATGGSSGTGSSGGGSGGGGGSGSSSPGGGSGSGGDSGSGGGGGSSGGGSGSGGSGGGGGGAAGNASLPTGIQNILNNAAFSPQYGESASDLLNDQANLTYQIFNLRMLLERALSDRLLLSDSPRGEPRLQAVIGLNVSIDPAYGERDSAAIVELTVDKPGVELVAVMPQEKTYNSAALSTKASAFGGSAVVKMLTVSTALQRQSQVFYLYRDNDTLSFQRMAPVSGKESCQTTTTAENRCVLQFGWEFRPVLGRRSVSPGMRQLFAIVSLPASDTPSDANQMINVKVRTGWHHYDHHTLTTYYSEPITKKLSLAFSPNNWGAGLRGDTSRLDEVTAPSTASVETDLGAVVDDVRWYRTDANSGTVVIKGKNFFSGTTVNVGPQVYSEGNGLTIQSDQTMYLVTTVQQAALTDGVVNGRYGPPIPLAPHSRLQDEHIRIIGLDREFNGPDSTHLLLTVTRNTGLAVSDLPSQYPVIAYNGAPLPEVNSVYADSNFGGVVAEIYVSTATLGDGNGLFVLKFPFAGPAWAAKAPIIEIQPIITRADIDSRSTLTLLDTAVQNGVARNYSGRWQILLDQAYVVDEPDPRQPHAISLVRLTPCSSHEPTCHTLQLTVDKTILDAYKTFTLIDPRGNVRSYAVPPPAASTPPGKPSLDAKQPKAIVKQNEAALISYSGQSLNIIQRASFNGTDLTFTASADGKTLQIYMTPDVTKTPGPQQILLQADAQTILAAPLTIIAVSNPATTPNPTNPSKGATGGQQQN